MVKEMISEEKIHIFFDSETGKEILKLAKDLVSEYGMEKLFKQGVAVGFSGGADSVTLLMLLKYFQIEFNFPLCAIHINHGIRGEEAERDESFSEDFSRCLNIPFFKRKIDVPSLAKEKGISVELAAREARYSEFSRILKEENNYNFIATAHNATDNLETIIFNMLRGSGVRGLSGISPIRDNIIRPLLYVPKDLITEALTSYSIPFVTDSTNDMDIYTRNYIRHEILPKFKKLNPNPESVGIRLSKNLRASCDFIEDFANNFIEEHLIRGKISSNALRKLQKAPFSAVISKMAYDMSPISIEATHIEKIWGLILEKNSFSVDIPGGNRFICDDGVCTIIKKPDNEKEKNTHNVIPVEYGKRNILSCYGKVLEISKYKFDKSYLNVYKNAIQQHISSAIIVGDLYVRSRMDSDAYYYGGMTRKLKKLFCDRKIPKKERDEIPILCDEKGIVWVPGFGVRDDKNTDPSQTFWVTLSDIDIQKQE